MMRRVYIVFLSALLPVSVLAQSFSDERLRSLDSFILKIIQDWNVPGVAISIVEKDKIVYSGGWGYRDIESRLPVTANTQFPIGSCTKAFTALLTGILEEKGLMTLDNPIQHYLPDLRFNNDYTSSHITTRDLLSHRSGLPGHTLAWYSSPDSREQLVLKIPYLPISAELRERYQYCNFNYLLAGDIVEKVTGKSWEDNIRELILKPAGMENTSLSIEELETKKERSLAYFTLKQGVIQLIPYYSEIKAMGPAGSLNSSANDMSKWLLYWVNGGNYQHNTIIPASYLRLAITMQTPMGGGLPTIEYPDIYFSGYGLGWKLSSYKGHYQAEHDGFIDGFVANTCFFPSDSVGIFVVSNQERPVYAIRNFIADRMLQLATRDWNNYYLKSIRNLNQPASLLVKNSFKKDSLQLSKKQLHQYKGIYTNKVYGTVIVDIKNGHLTASLNRIVIRLIPEKENSFRAFLKYPYTQSEIPMAVTFYPGSNGSIGEVAIPLEFSVKPILFKK